MLENEPDGIDIKVSTTTCTEAGLHVCLLRRIRPNVVEPVGVDSVSGSS